MTVVQIIPTRHRWSSTWAWSVSGRARYSEALDATMENQVFGNPSEAVVETLRAQAGAGVPLSAHPEHLGGFARIGGHFLAGKV